MRELRFAHEAWPIAGSFTISRGAKTSADVLYVEIEEQGAVGRGEAVPYTRYGESMEAGLAELARLAAPIAQGIDRATLQTLVPPGAVRNALDCALWDLEAKKAGAPVWQLAGLPQPQTLVTAYTLSLGSPVAMEKAAAAASSRPLLKLKLGGDGLDAERVAAVRSAASASRLIVDANEAWRSDSLAREVAALMPYDIALIEQPLPAGDDAALLDFESPVPFCADESAHDRESLAALEGKYQAVNIKLDKTGGLTEALAMRVAAEAMGFEIMVGCMVATSLAMAPAFLVAQGAAFVDLDGPLLLTKDRDGGHRFENSLMHPPATNFWG